MKIQTTLVLLSLLLLPLLPACSSTPAGTATGLDPYEREHALKRQPLSDDPNSPMHNMRAADGKVGLKVAEF